jgi:hypothetical protein
MMTALIICLALVAATLVIELMAAVRAPFGYEDESGFHFGREGACRADEFECGNPS